MCQVLDRSSVDGFYDPTTAQFLTRDPLDALTRSAYGYVYDNPLNNTDPLGLCSKHSGAWGAIRDKACQAGEVVETANEKVTAAAHKLPTAVKDQIKKRTTPSYWAGYVTTVIVGLGCTLATEGAGAYACWAAGIAAGAAVGALFHHEGLDDSTDKDRQWLSLAAAYCSRAEADH